MRRRSTAQALALRSRIVPECAEGHSIMEVSRRLKAAPDTVRTWRSRFLARGLDGLPDEPRPGVPRKNTDADVERAIVETLEEKPANDTYWSTRSMAPAGEPACRPTGGGHRGVGPPGSTFTLIPRLPGPPALGCGPRPARRGLGHHPRPSRLHPHAAVMASWWPAVPG
ncbi:helix-turn-helix domain-containing protein [Streptomyces barringtoniae]|uniref:helix-turn-helix domain-containing protein n=1 Tax=Streptomyces barringtoniae TaxID=2892029 RepID=UPI001E2BE315|nr:helix-turn-helix domain-containing protein [Streptomyces barringtoniae]MCC5475778.1 helix-turn-helix domain-containing protein [Streptomyces barringtoniae]